ncbi:hypothetical protein [Microbacterium sp. SMR1]|uniref:hypothetical protein n=1 Tax=Microbacterium sp. SMR1 TaxID=1497340 RepID=UPI000DCD4999|nr:hypothetical protein [Microbacterium sp. SMR1]RAZ31728.1 hypothetical protein DO944_12540 [Microbacterium sp. SMR1]
MRARQRLAVVATIVAAAGLTGACAGTPDADPYPRAREQFTAMADELHTVIMAIEPIDWRVDQGQYGARPSGCQLGVSSDTGYSFTAVRALDLPGREAAEIAAAASEGFAQLGVDAGTVERGSGDAREVTVVGESDAARTVVVIRPVDGRVLVSSETACTPGSSSEILTAIFGEEQYPDDVWRRLPATEGPSSVPQFSFPPGSPLHYDATGAPILPPPR